jgi:TetR/AcrR family transcriptional repressor of bet genes
MTMRKSIRDIRRDELIAATMTAIHRHGFAAVTIGQIAEVADASVGSISYYFGGKDRLLEGAMRRLLTILRECAIGGLRTAETPRARLEAVVRANFDVRLFSKEKCSVWMQFWAFAPYTPRLARLHRLNRGRVSSNLRAELRKLLPADDVDNAQRSLQAYMDGVWLAASQGDGTVDAVAAQTAAAGFLTTLLARDAPHLL